MGGGLADGNMDGLLLCRCAALLRSLHGRPMVHRCLALLFSATSDRTSLVSFGLADVDKPTASQLMLPWAEVFFVLRSG